MTNITDEQAMALLDAARQAAGSAYAPYSGFPVGASVLTTDGTIVSGCNVENASYGLTVCAERVAVWSAVAQGHRSIEAVAVFSPQATELTPCGACRQVLWEFTGSARDMDVIIATDGGYNRIPLSQLLPRAFGPATLEESNGF